MPTCAVVGCQCCSTTEKTCQTFPLPPQTSRNLLQEWIQRINRKDYIPNENTRVCKCHFLDEAFIPDEENLNKRGEKRTKKQLKPLAVPTLKMKPSITEIPMKRPQPH